MSTTSNHHHPPQYSPQSQIPYKVPPVTLILTIVLLVFFFTVVFSICLCRYFMGYLFNASLSRRIPSGNAGQPTASATNGLDSSIIDNFPTFDYSSVKDLQQENCGLECAVCLLEFEDHDRLRLLTVCNHVFHTDCIDVWFGNHTTCPLCRRSLIPQEISPQNNVTTPPENNQQERETREDNNSESREDEEEENREVVEVVVEVGDSHEGATSGQNVTQDEGQQGEEVVVERFSRYHSTGHSIIHVEPEVNIDDDRYTLRLPDHVREDIIRGHHWSGSSTTFAEFSNNAGRKSGFSELSSFPAGSNVNKM